MKRRSLIFTGVGFGAVLFAAAAFGTVQSRSESPAPPAAALAGPAESEGFARISGASLERTIASLQARLKQSPTDYVSWATLGLAYVQQAKVSVNSDFYPLAQGTLEKSLAINTDDNFLAYAGLSALSSARHNFAEAKAYAEQGLKINEYNAILYGALSDAQSQLGDYSGASASVQRMLELNPNTASLSRASYIRELKGDVEQAGTLMQRALDDAPKASDRAFALYYLGELAFNGGDANGALTYYRRALDASPSDSAALAGKAKAEAALGQYLTALDDYAVVVQQTPEPSYLIEYGELLQSLGRQDEADQQYAIFATTERLFESNGVAPDSVQTLFYANHGQPDAAMIDADKGIATRPFLAMYDAYAWALHVNGRDAEALIAVNRALSTGMRNASFHFHKGMINLALGDREGARAELEQALAINRNFSPLDAPIALETLAQLESLP